MFAVEGGSGTLIYQRAVDAALNSALTCGVFD